MSVLPTHASKFSFKEPFRKNIELFELLNSMKDKDKCKFLISYVLSVGFSITITN